MPTEIEHCEATHAPPRAPEELYLDLLKQCLTRSLFEGRGGARLGLDRLDRLQLAAYRRVVAALDHIYNSLMPRSPSFATSGLVRLRALILHLCRRYGPIDWQARAEGRDWPADAETMIGVRRLDNLQDCITDVLQRDVPGDLIEAGAWRGGATIFMRGVLKAYGNATRCVWVADSFQGLPKPDAKRYPADAGHTHWTLSYLAVPLEAVQANFARYGLLDEQVHFLVGWFRDTLPTAPIERLTVLRVDGDMYESTIEALRALYPKLSIGGYVIIDDYGDLKLSGCKRAVDDFRAEQGVTERIERIDWTGVYWQRVR